MSVPTRQAVPSLQPVIARLYENFAIYPHNVVMEASPLHADQMALWTANLQSAPLPKLNASQLTDYVGRAISTWGSVDDFKHYLPRILELTAQFDAPYAASIVFGKLEYAGWRAWPSTEVKAIEEYLLALWIHLLQHDSEKAAWEFNAYLQGILSLYTPPAVLLEHWANDHSKTATIRLAKFLYEEQTEIFGKNKKQGKGYDPALVNWLLSDEILARLEAAYFEFEQEDIAATISWAEKVLRDQRYNAGIE